MPVKYLNHAQFKTMMGLNKPEPVTSLIASGLNVIKQPLDYYAIDKRVPLVGGQSIADLIGLTGTQSLIQDFSQRKPMIQAGMPDARFIDVASMIPMIKPAAVATGQSAKYLGKEALRQGYEGTGLLGKIAPDIKMPIVAWHGSPHKMASGTEGLRAVDVFGNGSLVEHYDDARGLMFSQQTVPSGNVKWTAWDTFPQSEGGNQPIGEMFSHDSLADAMSSVRGARISAALKARNAEKYGSIPNLWGGEAKKVAKSLIDAGIGIDRFASSTQSKSKYIYTNAGAKIRLADHALPLSYDAADVDYRYGGDIQALIADILKAEKY